jgi:hypothetical protein
MGDNLGKEEGKREEGKYSMGAGEVLYLVI